MNYLRAYRADSQPEQSGNWTGTVEYSGGKGGDMDYYKDNHDQAYLPGSDGQQGTLFQSKCFPGYSGVFCKPCPVGTYKYDYSYGTCQPCINKPALSVYSEKA